ncbi:hypothetical protein Bra471DRAFT_01486 [Bradyrhizobium sp. WSM471]|nr:hypothetical protein Bra471DRAFT_01486 [Bradyrhizobium sp. WSM471]
MAASVIAGSGKTLFHSPEGPIGSDQHGAPLVARADELEQHTGLGLVLGHIGQIVKDKKIKAIETIDGGLEVELAPRPGASARDGWCG